ncbi:hypothetical protein WN865_00920 [Tetragenococcus halophilus]
MLGETIRKTGFWFIDLLTGSKVRNHYKEIKKINENIVFRKNKIDSLLKSLLEYVTSQSEFYSKYKDVHNIEDFPIVDKKLLIKNYDQILSEQYKHEKVYRMSTSGSTGTPFTVVQNINKRKRVQAELIYFGKQAGFTIGEQNTYLRVWNENNKKSKLETFMKNLVMLDNSKLDDESLENIREQLKNHPKLKCILGYAASLDVISRYLLNKGDSPEMFGVEVVISGAEVLEDETRNNLKKLFNCKVVSRYSNQENGILAQEPCNGSFFVINHGSYYVEFLKIGSNEKAQSGDLARVIITDLFNYAMPMIRYDTGDYALITEVKDYGRVIENIEGRKMDFVYDSLGNMISPHSISINMKKFSNISKFQFIQNERNGYTIKLEALEDKVRDSKMIGTFKNVLGNDAHINVEYVDEIPFTKSGKFRFIINNYHSM